MLRALAKDDWVERSRPYSIVSEKEEKRHIYADVLLEHRTDGKQLIIVEVKCFPESRSQLDEFYHAIGQYQVYQMTLKLNQINTPIYLAVPETVFKTLFQKEFIKKTVKHIKIKLIIVNLEREEIVRWQT
jgi:uncharacterized protein (UPF0128 family)